VFPYPGVTPHLTQPDEPWRRRGIRKKSKASKSLLQPHERALVASGELSNVTHPGALAVWLEAASKEVSWWSTTNCQRRSPTRPFPEGPAGRRYSEKYLTGHKWVDTAPTTVIEFDCPSQLIEELFAIQHKPEDGALSMGLGHKAGGGLPLFNQSLANGATTWNVWSKSSNHLRSSNQSNELLL